MSRIFNPRYVAFSGGRNVSSESIIAILNRAEENGDDLVIIRRYCINNSVRIQPSFVYEKQGEKFIRVW